MFDSEAYLLGREHGSEDSYAQWDYGYELGKELGEKNGYLDGYQVGKKEGKGQGVRWGMFFGASLVLLGSLLVSIF